jgi:RNA polymerase sigma-70 factor, ECF subfamily
MTPSTDAELVRLTRLGDGEAFTELVHRYQAAVFSVCYRMLGERQAAEDVSQETFVRVYTHLGSYQTDRPFGPWIRRVAANLSINWLNANRLLAAPLDEETQGQIAQEAPTPEEAAIQGESGQKLSAAIRRLRPTQRAVLELSHFHALSYAEIATELNLPLSDVKSHLFRARKHLAEILNHE